MLPATGGSVRSNGTVVTVRLAIDGYLVNSYTVKLHDVATDLFSISQQLMPMLD